MLWPPNGVEIMKYDSPRAGVEWHIWNRYWEAFIVEGGRRVRLGCYRDVEEAIRAVEKKEPRQREGRG